MAGLRRYRRIGPFYDLISMERMLYAAPRRRLLSLMSLMSPHPGATVVDVGCGTGLNFAGLHQTVGPTGHIVGIDSSPSMLAAAEKRIRHQHWTNITTLHGDIEHLLPALEAAGVRLDDVDALIATYVISTLHNAGHFWDAVDHLCARRQRLIAIADIGRPNTTRHLCGLGLRTLSALGGSQPHCQPWNDLVARSKHATVETHLGGHVRLAVGYSTEPVHG